MPKPNIGELLKKSFEAIENEVRPPVDTEKTVDSSKKGKKMEKKARTVCKKGEKKTKKMKAEAKKKNKGKAKAETEPFYEKCWHLDKVNFDNCCIIL